METGASVCAEASGRSVRPFQEMIRQCDRLNRGVFRSFECIGSTPRAGQTTGTRVEGMSPTSMRKGSFTNFWRRSDTHRGNRREHSIENHQRDRHRRQRLAERQTFQLMAVPLPRQQQVWRPPTIRSHNPFGEPRRFRASTRRTLTVEQQLGIGCIPPSLGRTKGHAQGDHRNGAQARPNGLLHAEVWNRLCRQITGGIRATAQRTPNQKPQTARKIPRI